MSGMKNSTTRLCELQGEIIALTYLPIVSILFFVQVRGCSAAAGCSGNRHGNDIYMTKPVKREYFIRSREFLSSTGPQARFILFLIFLLIAYTFLIMVFRKLAKIVDLPVFIPIALTTLIAFIVIAGTLYSHRFVGPMVRIRKALEQVAQGDCSVTLRLRDSDDPMLQDLVRTIGGLCEHNRHAHRSVHDAAQGLFTDLAALQESIAKGVQGISLEKQLAAVHQRQATLEKAVQSLGT
jgi:methyl-accepting chemotaxis protein